MANNAFNFKGLYDKIAGLLKNSAIVTPGEYSPTQNDYVAVYKDVPNSAGTPDSTIAVKQYVSVTDIGTGGGGGGSMTSFEVTGEGGITLSLDGSTYDDGPLTIENADNLRISATVVPNGLNWEGPYDSGTTYQLNDVVSNVAGGIYSTWLYINNTPAAGQALPVAPDTFNTYWAQLGTQGPPGATGPIGTNAVAIYGFRSVTSAGGTVTNAIIAAGSPGDGTNSTGCIIKVNNTSLTTELVVQVNLGLNLGFPLNSQITFVNVSAEGNAPVKIVGQSGVTVNSADNAQYLRTLNSTCSLVRENTNIYWMFGDLTNIS